MLNNSSCKSGHDANGIRRRGALLASVPALSLFSGVSLLAFSSTAAQAQTWGGSGALSGTTNDAAHSWNQNANWTSPATFPNAVGATANVTADFTAATTIYFQAAPITVGTINLNDTGASGDVAITLSAGSGSLVLDNTGSTNAILTSTGTGNIISSAIALNDNVDVSTTSSLTLSGTISGSSRITKLDGFGSSMSLSGNNTGWSGGVSIQRGTVNAGSFTAGNAVLGTGPVTFENKTVSTGLVILAINSNVSRTYANNFIQNNENANAGGQYAEISTSGGSSGNRVTTFNGTFSTGANYVATQALLLRPNTNDAAGTAGRNESTYVVGGSWANYLAGAGNASAIRIGQGSVLLNAANAVAGSGGYSIEGNDAAGGSKLILGAASTTVANNIQFAGGANGLRNSFGVSHTTGTSTVNGNITLSDLDGANVFAATGGTLAVGGNITGANALRINDGYQFTSADVTTGLQAPAGVVNLTRSAGTSMTGAVTVVNGTLLANNVTGSATGSNSVTVGAIGNLATGVASTGVIGDRIVTGISNATAANFIIGQTITGGSFVAGTKIAGVTLGVSTATIAVSTPVVATNPTFDVAALTTTATLGGSGVVAGNTTINAGSTLSPGNSPGVLSFGGTLSLGGITSMEVNGTTRDTGYDGVNTTGLLTYGGSLGIAFGATTTPGTTYDLFQIGVGLQSGSFASVDVSGTYTATLVNTSGVWAGDDTTNTLRFTFTQSTGDLVVTAVPEPASLGVLGLVGLMGLRRRTRRAV